MARQLTQRHSSLASCSECKETLPDVDKSVFNASEHLSNSWQKHVYNSNEKLKKTGNWKRSFHPWVLIQSAAYHGNHSQEAGDGAHPRARAQPWLISHANLPPTATSSGQPANNNGLIYMVTVPTCPCTGGNHLASEVRAPSQGAKRG